MTEREGEDRERLWREDRDREVVTEEVREDKKTEEKI